MTPALSILCAVLVAAAARFYYLATIYDHACTQMSEAITRKDALIAEAHALLHDTAARGKDARWIPWSERRAAWVKKCEVWG